jgi:hypothetical protein
LAVASIFDPLFLGVDEFGQPVFLRMMYRNILIAGEPGSGKSVVLNDVVGTAALATDCRLCLIDFTDRWELHWRFDLRFCVAYMFATGLCRRHAGLP